MYQKGSKTTVAIKATKGTTEGVQLRDFLHEIKIMSHIRPHLNLVNMIGSCSRDLENQRKLWLIIEFCHCGELKCYLIENKKQLLSGTEDDSINSRCLLNWSHDIAKGMEFLSSNNIRHGDLAARNVMLDDSPIQSGRPVAKVADFGLSKQLETGQNYKKENSLMINLKNIKSFIKRWLALTKNVQYSFKLFTIVIFLWTYPSPKYKSKLSQI